MGRIPGVNLADHQPARGTRLPRSARRTQLLGAARDVFVAQGYHAAAMDDIAERAGVSKPVLYQHFPGKLDLYVALLDEGIEALLAAVRDGLASTTDNKLRVTATTQAYFDFVSDPGGAFRLVFESDLTSEPAVRERVERVLQECAELVSAVIAADAGLSEEQAHLLRRRADRQRAGDGALLGDHRRGHPQGRGRAAGLDPGLARHLEVPPHERLTGSATVMSS